MAKSIHSYDFIRGLRASIPDFAPGFEEHEGHLVSLEIICPEPFGETPVELHSVDQTQDRHALQKTVYYLMSEGKRLGVYPFLQQLQENLPWLKGLVVPRIRILVGPEQFHLCPVIELEVEPQTEDGRFVMSGLYTLEEKERTLSVEEPPFDTPESLLRSWLRSREENFSAEDFDDLQRTTRKVLEKLKRG